MNDVPLNDKDLQLVSLIQQMAQQHQPELPSPGVIWWRAQLLKKMEDKKRVERPIIIMRMVVGAIGLIVTAWLTLNCRVEFADRIGFSGTIFHLFLLSLGALVVYLLASLRESRS